MKQIVLLWITLSLSACSGVNDTFQCGAETQNACLSVPEVNQKVNEGEISIHSGSQASREPMALSFVSEKMEYPTAIHIDGKPMRFGETIHGIWIAPFEDRDGNYHAAQRVFVVTNTSHWIKNPPSEILEEEVNHD